MHVPHPGPRATGISRDDKHEFRYSLRLFYDIALYTTTDEAATPRTRSSVAKRKGSNEI